MRFTSETPDVSRSTSPAPMPPLGEIEGLLPAPQTVPSKKSSLLSVFPWLANIVCRHPFFSAVLLYTVLACLVAGVGKSSYNLDRQGPDAKFEHKGDGIVIVGYGREMDITRKMVSISWMLFGCGAYALFPYLGPIRHDDLTECDVFGREVDIYFNDASKPIFSYDPGNIPFHPVYYPTCPHALISFDVVHDTDVVTLDPVPFDAYRLKAFVFAIERTTNKSVPILRFAAGDGPDNFVLSSVDWQMNSTWTHDSGTGPTTAVVESRMIEITVKRSQLAQAFTVCLLFINTALTIGSVYVTVLVIVRRDAVNDALLLLPVSTVLTIPALRGLYVGSPPFGIYLDTFGFFLQMMTVAMCSMILLYMAAAPPTQDRRASHGGREGYISRFLNSVFHKRSGDAA